MSPKEKEPTFEEAFKRLSEIVEILESGDGTLTEMTQAFEEGVKLSKICSGHLDSIEQKVEILLGVRDAQKQVPFEDSQTTPDGGCLP